MKSASLRCRIYQVRFSKKILTTCAALFLFSQILFLINIQFPRGQNFDEFHYVPSAKQFLELKENQNWEHPPLAKELMAVGIAVWGDRPIGWRYMSTLFASFTLVGMYLWALALFREEKIALWVAILTIVNQLLYVQARIGMLDTFMFAFIVWGMAAFTEAWQPAKSNSKALPKPVPVNLSKKDRKAAQAKANQELFSASSSTLSLHDMILRTRRLIYLTGICFGFATACKWFGVIPWALCIALVVGVKLIASWETQFMRPSPDDWYHSELWIGIELKDWIVGLVVLPLAAYFITFFPFLFINAKDYGFFDIFTTMQAKMWDGQGRVVSSHPYMSTWTDWPLLRRPIWYAFDKEGANNELVRGVLLIGNPIIMFSGLVAVMMCAWGWFRERRRDAFLILVSYLAFYFSWAVIPRKVSFFYYYYPAGMVLSLALGYVFYHGEKAFEVKSTWPRWVFFGLCLGMFIYFFPISAALQIPADSFRQWMWRMSWI